MHTTWHRLSVPRPFVPKCSPAFQGQEREQTDFDRHTSLDYTPFHLVADSLEKVRMPILVGDLRRVAESEQQRREPDKSR